MKSVLPRRIINDIIMALASLDGHQEPILADDGRCTELRPRPLVFDPETRLQLAANLGAFRQAEIDLRRRHAELVKAHDPVQDGDTLRIPPERLPAFRRAWADYLDESQSVEIRPFPVEGLRGGSNRMPLSMLAFLFYLADPASLTRRFGQLTADVRLSRRGAGMLLAALTGLEGRLAAHPDGTERRQVTIPWSFDPEVREQIAFDFHVLHRLGAELAAHRPGGDAPAEAAWLDEELTLRLVPLRAVELHLEANAIPLSTLHQLAPLIPSAMGTDGPG